MQKSSSRLIELDFLRGLVLLIILVDHIGGSVLSHATLHTFALCDATEVFVFLGGFATATAYAALAGRRSEATARTRFLRRSLEIYRAFLVTAGLMLLVSAVLIAFSIDAPNLTLTDLDDLLDAPLDAVRDILLLRRQPYLASVLPMYAFFALTAPLVVPLARRRPLWLLAGSTALWAAAPQLADYLPTLEDTTWNFNPLAWQLLFVLGVIARCQPVHQKLGADRAGWLVSVLAFTVVAAAAALKLIGPQMPFDPGFKQNLSWLRAVNFVAIAWLAANLIRRGWVRKCAQWLPWVGMIGRKGLVCFIAGAVISLVVDSLLYAATDGYLNVSLGLLADTLAIGALAAVAWAAEPIQRVFAWRLRAAGTGGLSS
ncbi:OpgC domain-containing protein [Paraburkholderia sp. DHOC27]|uniref:OpgC domain-containing protein n=1 Tax=Paraburkholderia sp. DHOC27 TaxID=2303330 RepID=UPI000E3DCE43|nr:OpgC domain-containing protein [Paraburkholderia sp. DHOC27]RFU49515.1 OpgC domain-containing protein [Paraburkholderia sp. DHOC27]